MTTRAIGFDNEQYLDDQSQSILERMGRIGGKLYLEFGGKIAFDYHAARVLPGYDPNVKIRLLQHEAPPEPLGGHSMPRRELVTETLRLFDRYLGPTKQASSYVTAVSDS